MICFLFLITFLEISAADVRDTRGVGWMPNVLNVIILKVPCLQKIQLDMFEK